MILSASDIYALLSRDPILGALTNVRIINTRPPLEAGNGVIIYVKKYPSLDEFEATWNIWIVDYDEEPLDVIIGQIRRLLPRFTILEEGAIIKATTTELRSEKTEIEPPPLAATPAIPTVQEIDDRFEELQQSIEDRMLLVGPGRPGKDGKNGKDGRDGIDGKDGRDGLDLAATETNLGELADVYVDDARRGQVLTFDGSDWVARFAPQILKGSGGGIAEAPNDGKFYVRLANNTGGEWVDLLTAIQSLNLDAGDFDA